MVDTGPPRFSLDELAEASGVPRRTIRYYISEGMVSPAFGRGRSAYYTSVHLEELERARALREHGLALAEIKEQRKPKEQVIVGEHWERFRPHPALEIHLRADAPAYVRALAERLVFDAEAWLREPESPRYTATDSVQLP
ncbi:MAG: MerR family transcriptional regulator [Chloroflexi bacterium]|nr:MAG: MerR family transcriptional regulator [Chloroflexota bacterium]